VNLWSGGMGDKRSGAYSGGMKRRLSVAISLIGDPWYGPTVAIGLQADPDGRSRYPSWVPFLSVLRGSSGARLSGHCVGLLPSAWTLCPVQGGSVPVLFPRCACGPPGGVHGRAQHRAGPRVAA